ncbi:MAG: chemotaxis protein CheA [Lachnospiraceae bacterium]|nr:chemotaxis protein CheA [Lachnospiraceae bacterium]
MDVSQYLEIFIDETNEHLQSLSDQLMILENEPGNTDTINEIFRAAHSLKGMAGTMGYKRMQNLTHNMENVLSEIRNGKMGVSADLVDVLFQCLDALQVYLDNIQQSANEGEEDNEAIVSRLNDILNGKSSAPVNEVKAEPVKETKSETKLEIKFADFECNAVSKALEKGMNIYSLTVHVDENCILKAARAFLVFKSLEDYGEVIKSVPSAQDIEDERFDLTFNVIIVTNESLDKIVATVKNVSEIREVETVVITSLDEIQRESSVEKADEPKTEVSVAKDNAPATKQPAATSSKPAATGGKPVVNRSVRVDIEKLDVLMNLVSELIIAKNGLISVSSNDEGSKAQGFNEQIEYLERVTTNLHESVMKVRMMPIETVTNKFPRMVRDLAKKLNKQIELTMNGEETELDRTVIDEIGDPLMHIIRNSCDHGLEKTEIRRERGKSETGHVVLNAYQDGNNVVIEVSDDGNGIDVENVKNKAIEKGTITPEQAETMSDKDIVDLLFKPSFSTAKEISDVSGRGVGLDVVKTKIEALGGDVEVKTALGEGSTFIIRLPLTLAIIQALMVEVGIEKYAIPLGNIQTIEDIPVTDIKYVHSKEVINLRGDVIPIVRLEDVLDIAEEDRKQTDNLTVVIIKKGERMAGLVIDSLIGQQEIVIKSLGKYISSSTKIISGATILGDGEVALILDVNTLV